MEFKNNIAQYVHKAPRSAGVYLFKQADGAVIYIGKARVLRTRLQSYLNGYEREWKATQIIRASSSVEWYETTSELEALLLEARLVQSYQPPFNVLLKTGQPYVYYLITQDALPRFEVVRTKTKKGTYFGPFIDKSAARAAYRFLLHTFRLGLCTRTIEHGCLAYHLGRCAGVCRSDFNRAQYEERLMLLHKALRSKPTDMYRDLDMRIQESNAALTFERSAELVRYKQALEKMYESVSTGFDKPLSVQRLAEKDIWIWLLSATDDDFASLFLFRERGGVLKKERVWRVARMEEEVEQELSQYIFEYYRVYRPSPQVLASQAFTDAPLLADFVREWHHLSYAVVVAAPAGTEHHECMAHAMVYAREESARPERMAQQLKQFLALRRVPRVIDCFDISHAQGHAMVGACVRFVDGVPDRDAIRHFHIKTVEGNNDYASLQEIIVRRYKEQSDLPDLIVIDGGKGQLSAAREVLQPILEGTTVDLVSLAKREETVFCSAYPEGKVLNSALVAHGSLVALRDYAHHRAISFHRQVRSKRVS